MKSKSKPKGLGDLVEKVATVTGIKSAVNSLLGEDCGCEDRRTKLNELFPMYKNIGMTNEQRKTWEDLQPAVATGRLNGKDAKVFRALYGDIFEGRHTWCGCGGEAPRRVGHIRKVYDNTCDT